MVGDPSPGRLLTYSPSGSQGGQPDLPWNGHQHQHGDLPMGSATLVEHCPAKGGRWVQIGPRGGTPIKRRLPSGRGLATQAGLPALADQWSDSVADIWSTTWQTCCRSFGRPLLLLCLHHDDPIWLSLCLPNDLEFTPLSIN